MPKKYELEEKRFIVVKKDEVCMLEDGTHKKATFSYSRWTWFTQQFNEIDDALSKMAKGETEVKLFLHLGGAWYVSVTSGVRCVDIRKFFMTQDGTIKPTRTGFAIRLREWDRVKHLATVIKTQNPKIAGAQPCWMGEDHQNQEGAMNCNECNPYGTYFALPTNIINVSSIV